ncbi:lysine--tRNA ligase-like [Rutidosis leptorrhynchoides]|uniref:lysine--tRNA ligase-like n=1 Tax=Rutidosis leptorrhynchoides TaxID=125765 RepID=UPI003A9974A1
MADPESFENHGVRKGKNLYESSTRYLELSMSRAEDTGTSYTRNLRDWSPEDEDMDPSKYFEKRLRTLEADHKAGKKLYPRGFSVSMSIPEFLNKYGSLKADERMEDAKEYLAGRVMNKLTSSNMITYDLVGFDGQIQVMAFPKFFDENATTFFKLHSDLKNGDYIGVIGFPGKSRIGELSVIQKKFVNLSYCLHKMPPTHYKVKTTGDWTPGNGRYPDAYILNDEETRFRRRFLDLTINSEIKDIFKTRTKVVSYIRQFLEILGFLEAETPTLTMFPGGRGGKRGAFVTRYHDDRNLKMFMRNGHENVYLKQLVVGGIESVFEIGKQFINNEGEIDDLMHNNPEVTTCEFYMGFASYKDLMELTEQILSGMVMELTGGYTVTYHADGYHNPPIEIDFTPPFRRISMIKELEKIADLRIPKDLESEEARQYLADACTKFHINCSPPQTTPRLLHKLVEHFVEEKCVNPTFIIDHPEITSPLAKAHESKQGLTERFTLFINKLEVVNGYTVENDPVVQRQRFSDQLKVDTTSGNEEAMAFLEDETFWMALDYGLPPTGGWVLGIDKLTMLLTDSLNIKEVILFPAMKPQPHVKPPPIKGEKILVTGGVNDDDNDNDWFLLQSPNTTQPDDDDDDDEYHLNAKLKDELNLN